MLINDNKSIKYILVLVQYQYQLIKQLIEILVQGIEPYVDKRGASFVYRKMCTPYVLVDYVCMYSVPVLVCTRTLWSTLKMYSTWHIKLAVH